MPAGVDWNDAGTCGTLRKAKKIVSPAVAIGRRKKDRNDTGHCKEGTTLLLG